MILAAQNITRACIGRRPFQQKIGAGLTREAFQAPVEAGLVRPLALAESITTIARALGWRMDRIR